MFLRARFFFVLFVTIPACSLSGWITKWMDCAFVSFYTICLRFFCSWSLPIMKPKKKLWTKKKKFIMISIFHLNIYYCATTLFNGDEHFFHLMSFSFRKIYMYKYARTFSVSENLNFFLAPLFTCLCCPFISYVTH